MALPDTPGVHANTFSGEPSEEPQVALNVPVPLVVPEKVPPPGGMTIGLAQASGGSVVVVEEVVVVIVGQLGVVTLTGALFADSFPWLSTAEMA